MRNPLLEGLYSWTQIPDKTHLRQPDSSALFALFRLQDFTYRRAGSWLGDSGVECLTESNGGSHQNSNRSLPSDVPSSKATEELFDSGTGTSCSSESARSEANNNNNNSSSHKKASKDKDNKMASGDQGGEGRQQENNNSASPLSIDKELYLLNQKIESIQLECDAMMRREEKTSTTGTPSKTTSPAPTKKTPVRPSHLRLSPLLGGSTKEFDEPLYALPIDTFGSSVPLERKSLSPPTPPRNYVQGRPPHFGGALGSKTRRNFSEPRLTDIAPTPSPLGPAPCFRLPWESQLINLQEKKSAASKLAEWTRKLREKTTGTKDQPSPLRRIASLGRRSSFRERSASASKANSVSVESDLGKQPPEVRNSLNGSLERKTHSIQHPLLRSSPPPSASHYPLARPPPPAYSSPRLTLKVDKQASSHLVLSEQNKQDPNPVLVALPPKCSSCGRGQPTRPPRSGKKDAGGSDEQSKASLHRDSSDIYASKINPTAPLAEAKGDFFLAVPPPPSSSAWSGRRRAELGDVGDGGLLLTMTRRRWSPDGWTD
ncbi:unnamed protein product [Cyprideis torosa]|uniref:Uncharacterized protein n=1 Tax=Cyprideis torosa TaxID=163714 RepID=A0A7R8W8W6_9CRUS|nr:unnamed protein product [Cyprideis torosa]CAG0884247.1 unnamed protein product [Cyprideis torosa]